MSEHDQAVDWFLARDGQQHGPLSDTEVRKLVELGHLRPTDLVWRQGFQDWVAANTVFTAPPPAPTRAPAVPPSSTVARTAAPTEAADPERNRPATAPEAGSAQTSIAPAAEYGSAPQRHPHRQPTPSGPVYAGAQASMGGALRSDPSNPRGPVQGTGAQAGRGLSPQHRYAGPRSPAPGAPEQFHPLSPDGPAAVGRGSFETANRLDIGDASKRGFPWLKIVVALVFAVAIGAGAAFWVKGGVSLGSVGDLFAGSAADAGASTGPPVVRAPKDSARQSPSPGGTASGETLEANPVVSVRTAIASAQPKPVETLPENLGTTAAEIDASLQRTKVWQILKKEFPDWYGERIQDALRAKTQRKDDIAVSGELTQALVKLRREHAEAALSASPARLKAIATTFIENLDRLAGHSTEACYGYISSGETDPLITELMRSSDLAAPLLAQLAAIFEAIADGRKAPKQQAAAQREDFDALSTQLGQRGWGPQDLQLFSDARALSRAAPNRVCKMVRDWFAAQLELKDEAMQVRLLVETLKPVVAG